MKKAIFATLAVVSGLSVLMLNMDRAEASASNAKVTRIVHGASSDGFGPFVQLQIDFNKSLGSNCTIPGSGVYRLYMVSDAALREVGKQNLEGIRQLATAAMLSGREMNVSTNGCAGSWHNISEIQLL